MNSLTTLPSSSKKIRGAAAKLFLMMDQLAFLVVSFKQLKVHANRIGDYSQSLGLYAPANDLGSLA